MAWGKASADAMLVTTTPGVEGRKVAGYLGLVSGEAILGANILRDVFARVRDVVGGRAGAYERSLRQARDIALEEMIDEAKALGADAIVGVDLDYETVGEGMLMVSASGTAVRLG